MTDDVNPDAATPPDPNAETLLAEKPDKEPEPAWFRRRLDEITRARRDEERGRLAAEEQAQHWKTIAEARGAGENEEKGDLKRDKFEDDESYLSALADRKISERLYQERIAMEQDFEKRRIDTGFQGRCENARKLHKDFDEVALGNHWSPTGPMAYAIRLIDRGPEVAYYLGQHVEEAAKIARLPPWHQAAEIGKIEERLASSRNPGVSSANQPIIPLRGSDGTFQKDPEKMTDAEWYESQRKGKDRR